MDVYIRDLTLRRIDLVEEFESFIWTSRYNTVGEFTMLLPTETYSRYIIREGYFVERVGSPRLMVIETIKSVRGTDGKSFVEVKGRSLEKLLMDRVIPPSNVDGHWTFNGTLGWVMIQIVERICVKATEFSSKDKIPYLSTNQYDPSTVSREVVLEPKTVYEAVKELGDEDGFGFAIYYFDNPSRLEFIVYRGNDLRKEIVFSETYDNLAEITTLNSDVDYKNVAYVKSGNMIQEVSKVGSVSGFERRVLNVDASDIKNPTESKLRSRGLIELAKHKRTRLVSGESIQVPGHKYGADYNVGDLVSIVDPNGQKSSVIISESVVTYDASGYRVYAALQDL